uniref:Uncharacterized protein n=1 Tax=Wuchereria bancrofti TaxID=6293 RepID=A0A1I8E9Z7_WUCBA
MENCPDETFDPENVKFQCLFDSIRQEFLQQLKEASKNYQLAILPLQRNYILQGNDVIAKRIAGNLMVAPCKSERSAIENIEFKGGLISKFEIERINAELEILFKLLQSLFCTSYKRSSNQTSILTFPVESSQTQVVVKEEIPVSCYIPKNHLVEISH